MTRKFRHTFILAGIAAGAVAAMLVNSSRASDESARTGAWEYLSSVLLCDGYLSRNAVVDHCEKEIPDDWRQFEFEGQIYYAIPLTAHLD